MAAIARLATFVLAFALLVTSFVAAWFHVGGPGDPVHIVLNPVPFRGSSGLLIKVCDDCPGVFTGRLPGGLAWLGAHVALQFGLALGASGLMVLRGHRHTGVAAWAVLSALALALLTLGVIASFAGPPGYPVATGLGAYALLGACALTVLGHTRVLDRLDGPVRPATAPPPPAPRLAVAGVARDVRTTAEHVRRADLGHAGLRLTTDTGERRVAWTDITRAQLITAVEPAVELTLFDVVLRFSRKSVVDYRFLPGAPGGTPADDLRRLYDYARERNPALRTP